MRYTIIIIAMLLFGCEKSAIERDRRQLKGKWEMLRNYYNPDGPAINKRSGHADNWKLELKDNQEFIFNDGNGERRGKYRLAYTELHFDFLNDSGKISETWLWYDLIISNRRLTAYQMETDGVREYQFKKTE